MLPNLDFCTLSSHVPVATMKLKTLSWPGPGSSEDDLYESAHSSDTRVLPALRNQSLHSSLLLL